MQGFESSWDWNIVDNWYTSGSVSYVHGELVDRNQAIPLLPPFETKINLKYDWNQLTIGSGIRAAAKQNRTGEFENPTDGYIVSDFNLEYYFNLGEFLHTVAFSINNIGNTEYRQHLNRVKEIIPEPGRNIKLLYKVFF
jgi:iron complex outermembrane receptor protein